jgi:nucleoid-associated protein YgaU
VRDKQQLKIAWGDITSARGFIEWFEMGRESEEEIEWKLHILIDEDDTATTPQAMPVPSAPKDKLAAMQAAMAAITKLKDPRIFKPNLLDVLGSAIASLNAILAIPQNIVGQLSSLEQAVAGDIQRLRAGLGQLRTAFLNFRDLIGTTEIDAVTIGRSFTTDASAGGLFAKVDTKTMIALAAIAQLDRDAAIVQNGMLMTSTVAKAGDTWESISTRVYGAPDQADKLRQANGVRGSDQPVAGQTYQVPQAL